MKKLIILLLLFVVSCGTKQKSADYSEGPVEEAVIVEELPEEEIVEAERVEIEEQEANAVGNSGITEKSIIDYMEIEIPPRTSEMIILESEPSMDMVTDSIQVFVPTDADNVGRLVYEIPNEMVKFKTYTIEVRIGENENDVRIVRNIQPVVDTIIRTSELMQVELVDPTGISFRIISQSAQQLIEYDEYTTWIFYVTPLVHGENYISVVVSIVKNGNLKQTVYKDVVLVETSTWIEVKTFIGNYWQWLVGFLVTVAIPFFIWFIKYLKKRKEIS
jgi:hypothetical protein